MSLKTCQSKCHKVKYEKKECKKGECPGTASLDDIEEMDKFLETYNLPRLSHDAIEFLRRPSTSKETESVIKNLPTIKTLGPDGFTGAFYQTCKDELIPIIALHVNGLNMSIKIQRLLEWIKNKPNSMSFTRNPLYT